MIDKKLENFKKSLSMMGVRPLDILFVGATGAGKSTTINSLFGNEVARVGRGADPETMHVDFYQFHDFLRIWDSPGLGDGAQKDVEHSKNIINTLQKSYEVDGKPYGLIDIIFVIIEGSNRDMGTTYKLIKEVLSPNFQAERIILSINQADMAMKGRHWDYETSTPDKKLCDFLCEQSASIERRIKETTGISVKTPIFYSAEYSYNIEALYDAIIDSIPRKKRELVTN